MPHILTARSSLLLILILAGGGCGDDGKPDGPGTAGGLTGKIAVTAQAGAYGFALAATDEFHIDNPDVEIGVRRAARPCPPAADLSITSGLEPVACGGARRETEAFTEFVERHAGAIREAARLTSDTNR